MDIRGSIRSLISQQRGLTVVEIVVTLAIFSTLLGMSVGGLSYYLAGRSLETATAEVKTQIREAQALAVATGQTYRVDFSAVDHRSYQLQKWQSGVWSNVRAAKTLPGGVEFDTASLPTFGGDAYLEFYARGTAENGQLGLTSRYGKTASLQVDGETVNVR